MDPPWVFRTLFDLPFQSAGCTESIQPMASDQWFAPARHSLSKFHHPRINRLHASQNAAALLFDLETVDIR
jgi:hypothetical protein